MIEFLKYVANETNGTDLQKLKAIYPVLANTKLRIYYMPDEEFTGFGSTDYSLMRYED